MNTSANQDEQRDKDELRNIVANHYLRDARANRSVREAEELADQLIDTYCKQQAEKAVQRFARRLLDSMYSFDDTADDADMFAHLVKKLNEAQLNQTKELER